MKFVEKKDRVKQVTEPLAKALPQLEKSLRVIASGTSVALRKGRDLVPEADFALAAFRASLEGLSFTAVEVSREEALKFLAKEPLVLPGAPRGYLLLTFEGLGLGFVKNLGSRTNSLLPAARRIRKTITPSYDVSFLSDWQPWRCCFSWRRRPPPSTIPRSFRPRISWASTWKSGWPTGATLPAMWTIWPVFRTVSP